MDKNYLNIKGQLFLCIDELPINQVFILEYFSLGPKQYNKLIKKDKFNTSKLKKDFYYCSSD